MQKGARSFAEGNIHGLSGGGDMPQDTVPATVPVTAGSWPRWRTQWRSSQWRMQPCRRGAAGVPGASHWDLDQGARWTPCLQEVCADEQSVLPRKGPAGGDRQTTQRQR